MKVAIIGAGRVGRALAGSWSRVGHGVAFGVRDPEGQAAKKLAGDTRCRVGSLTSSCEDASAILLSVPSSALLSVATQLGPQDGKVLLDCSNPQSAVVHENDLPPVTLAEKLAELNPGARVVKIFNTVGWEVLGNPVFHGVSASMLYCCNGDQEAEVAHQLAADAGFEPIRLGLLNQSRMLEELTRLWGALAYGAKLGRGLGFKVLQREEQS